jgi:hypothetical protein
MWPFIIYAKIVQVDEINEFGFRWDIFEIRVQRDFSASSAFAKIFFGNIGYPPNTKLSVQERYPALLDPSTKPVLVRTIDDVQYFNGLPMKKLGHRFPAKFQR